MRRSSATKPMPLLPRCERTVEKKATSFSRPCGWGGGATMQQTMVAAVPRTRWQQC